MASRGSSSAAPAANGAGGARAAGGGREELPKRWDQPFHHAVPPFPMPRKRAAPWEEEEEEEEAGEGTTEGTNETWKTFLGTGVGGCYRVFVEGVCSGRVGGVEIVGCFRVFFSIFHHMGGGGHRLRRLC